MSMRWYAVQAFSGFEKSVQRSLEERIARSEFKDLFGEILVPVEEVVEMKAGQKTISERKLYPGYVLVQMDMTDDSWHLVKSTPRVTSFIAPKPQNPLSIYVYLCERKQCHRRFDPCLSPRSSEESFLLSKSDVSKGSSTIVSFDCIGLRSDCKPDGSKLALLY